MMYLSRVVLDPRNPSVRQALKDRQDMHRNLIQIFQEPILYRLMESRQSLEVYTLSPSIPDKILFQGKGMTLQSSLDLADLREKYKEGAIFRFNLLASPSKKKKEEDRLNSRRIFLPTVEERLSWMKRQGEKYGFDVLAAQEPSAEQRLYIGRKSGSFMITAIEITGTLQIRDASLFWNSWEKGIGAEKAYGLGLMLLSR